MSPTDDELEAPTDDVATAESAEGTGAEASEEEEEQAPERLNLDVKVDVRGACQRHVTVVISRDDITRYFEKLYSEIMGEAAVPGFRPGRAPRKVVENRFRKEVSERVKGSLILDSMTQLTADLKLAAISEPDIDPVAIRLPDSGPMTYEFNIEVRPDFELPDWNGLVIERPTCEFTEKDVERELQGLLRSCSRLVPCSEPVSNGDHVTLRIDFRHEGNLLSTVEDASVRVQPVLSLRDGRVENFGEALAGATAGETRSAKARLTEDAPNAAVRGKEIDVEMHVVEVKRVELPELTPSVLGDLGGFETREELYDAIRNTLQRQLEYTQQQRARQQVLNALVASASWDLPPDLLLRQTDRELERHVLELRRNGFSEEEVLAQRNQLRQNSRAETARRLKEHFILERLAEDEKIEAHVADYEAEIGLIARQSDESQRRVRAQLEKRGLMDTLRNQIIERKAIELILSKAVFHDTPLDLPKGGVAAIDHTAGGGDVGPAIPEAKYSHGEEMKIPGTDEKPKP